MDGMDSGADEPSELAERLPQDLTSPAAARAMIDRLPLTGDLRERLRLGLSELVTNSVRHAGRPGPVEVRVRRTGEAIRAEVTDPGDGFTWTPDGRALPPADQIGGRGLCLIERIADRWGSERLAAGAMAWFEVRDGLSAPDGA